MFKRIISATAALAAFGLLVPAVAAAHVVVMPAQVDIGAFQTFTTEVPNEKNVAVTQLKVIIPAGLQSVTPTVKPGWQITTEKTGQGDAAVLTSITWSGGLIPAGQRDDFTFSAQAPAQMTELHWKAFQTYQDGSTVAWDQLPTKTDTESDTSGPYSVTKVIDDLAAPTTTQTGASSNKTNILTLIVAITALIVSLATLLRSIKKA